MPGFFQRLARASLGAGALALVMATGVIACAPERGRETADDHRSAAGPGVASPGAPAAPRDDVASELARMAAARMAATLAEVGLDPSHTGSTVELGALGLEVDATIVHRQTDADTELIVAELTLRLDGAPVPAFAAEIVGVGPERDAALRSAIDQWYGQHGAQISFAIAEIERGAAFHPPRAEAASAAYFIRLLVDGVALYHSPVGLRGSAGDSEALTSETWTLALARLAIAHAGALGRYRGVSLSVAVDGEGPSVLSCRVDGREQPSLCAALAKLSWPRPAPSYEFSQSFVLLGPKSAAQATH